PVGIEPTTYALRVRWETSHNALSSTYRTPERSQRTQRPAGTRTVSHAVSHEKHLQMALVRFRSSISIACTRFSRRNRTTSGACLQTGTAQPARRLAKREAGLAIQECLDERADVVLEAGGPWGVRLVQAQRYGAVERGPDS